MLGFQKTMAPNSEQDSEGILEEPPETHSEDRAGAEARKGPTK